MTQIVIMIVISLTWTVSRSDSGTTFNDLDDSIKKIYCSNADIDTDMDTNSNIDTDSKMGITSDSDTSKVTSCIYCPNISFPSFAADASSGKFLETVRWGRTQTDDSEPLSASHGIVAMIIETGSSDQPMTHGNKLLKETEAFKAENVDDTIFHQSTENNVQVLAEKTTSFCKQTKKDRRMA